MLLDNEAIVSKFYEEKPFSHVPLDSYNWFISEGIKQLYDSMEIRAMTDRGYIRLKLVHDDFVPNRMLGRNDSEELEELFEKYHDGVRYELPIDILKKGGMYTATQTAFLVMTDDNGKELKRVHINMMKSFPMMVLSDLCPLSKIPRKEWYKIPHCYLDHGGYFIYKTEKVLINQEKLSEDTIFTMKMHHKAGDIMNPLGLVASRFLSTIGDVSRNFYVYVNKEKRIRINAEPFVSELSIFDIITVLRYAYDIKMGEREIFSEYMEIVPDELRQYLIASMGEEGESIRSLATKVKKRITKKDILAREVLAEMDIDPEDKEKNDLVRDMIKVDLGRWEQKYDTVTMESLFIDKLMNNVVERGLLPSAKSWQQKLKVLFDMVSDISRYHVEGEGLTDRNYYGQKLIVSPGMHIHGFFSRYVNDMRYWSIPVKAERQSPDKIFSYLQNKLKKVANVLHDEFRTAFVQKVWDTSNETSSVTVIEEFPTDSFLNRIVMTKKVAAFFTEASKAAQSRLYYPSYAHVICPAATPDSKKCGFTKHLTPSISISNNIPPTTEISVVKPMLAPNKEFNIYINNILYGKVDKEDYEKLQAMTTGEVDGVRFHFHTTVTLVKRTRSVAVKEQAIFIFTSKGRTVYPVLVLKNGTPVINLDGETEAVNRGDYTFSEMIEKGWVKYIDVIHSEFVNIALTQEHLKERSNWDYMYLSPSFFVGLEVNIMNFPNYNPVARIMLTVKQLKQMISIPFTNWKSRRDLEIKKLWYPQKQLFQTKMYKRMGLDKLGTCQNVLVAIATRGASEQDDAFMMKKEYYQRGGAVATLFKTVKIEPEPQEVVDLSPIMGDVGNMKYHHRYLVEYFPVGAEVPENLFKYGQEYNLDKFETQHRVIYKVPGQPGIGKDEWTSEPTPDRIVLYRIPGGEWYTAGEEHIPANYETKTLVKVKRFAMLQREIPNLEEENDIKLVRVKANYKSVSRYRTEVKLQKGDVIAKLRKTIDKEQDLSIETLEKNTLRSAVVDSFFADESAKKSSAIKVRLRSDLHPTIGDKFAFPYAQKGVLGIVQSEVDMPRLPDGRTPDIIINAQNFPSRNTVGMMLEMLGGAAILSTLPTDILRPIKNGDQVSTSVWKPIIDEKLFNSSAKYYSELTGRDKKNFDLLFVNKENWFESFDEVEHWLEKTTGVSIDLEGVSSLALIGEDFEIPEGMLNFNYINSKHWEFPGYEVLEKLIRNGVGLRQTNSLLNSFKTKKLDSYWEKKAQTDEILRFMTKDVVKMFGGPVLYSNFTDENQITMDDVESYIELPEKRDRTNWEKTPHYMDLGFRLDYGVYELIKVKHQSLAYRPFQMNRVQAAFNIDKQDDVRVEERLRDTGIEMDSKEEDFKTIMRKRGLNPEGTSIMYGPTGEIMGNYTEEEFIPEQFAVGYASILRLTHCVEEKYQARGAGKRKMTTNKPPKGKGRDGGISFGEMMTWSSNAHGISNFLREKLRDHSDKSVMMICSNCKRITNLTAENQCNLCSSADVAEVSSTFGLYLLDQYNSLMGNQLEFELGESDEIEAVVSRMRRQKQNR